MNFHWMYANKFLLIVVASTVALDGVLTTLVIHQQHNQSTINGQVTPRTAAPVPPAARVPALASPLPQWTPHLTPWWPRRPGSSRHLSG